MDDPIKAAKMIDERDTVCMSFSMTACSRFIMDLTMVNAEGLEQETYIQCHYLTH